MKEALTFLSAHLCVGIAQDEPNRCKKITFPRSIAADNDVCLGREGLDDGLLLVAG